MELPSDPRLAELRRDLAQARAQGVAFQAAWEPAVRRALAGATHWEEGVYGGALTATRAAWERAYIGVPATRLECLATELLSFAVDGELGYLSPEPSGIAIPASRAA